MSDFKGLYLTIPPNLVPRFFYLLQQGFIVKVKAGCSIQSLLCDQLGVSEEYLDKRIQTIFLDGKPVDDVKSTLVGSESVLALSAAMPGLVGAVLRKGGYYAAMRKEISHDEGLKSPELYDGKVVLKLFNLLTRELGPGFLEKGFWIKGMDLEDFISRQSDDFFERCSEVTIDGKTIDPERLGEIKWPEDIVFLKACL